MPTSSPLPTWARRAWEISSAHVLLSNATESNWAQSSPSMAVLATLPISQSAPNAGASRYTAQVVTLMEHSEHQAQSMDWAASSPPSPTSKFHSSQRPPTTSASSRVAPASTPLRLVQPLCLIYVQRTLLFLNKLLMG